MKTHGNQPNEIALLNHVSAYVGQTCYVVHRLDMETSGLVLFAKKPFIPPILNRLLEKKRFLGNIGLLGRRTYQQQRTCFQRQNWT